MGQKQDQEGPQNEDIWREANIGPVPTFLRKRRLRWYGHVLRKEGEDTTNKMLNIVLGTGKEKMTRRRQKSKGVAHKDKGGLIPTGERYVGRNLWICDIHGSACAIYGSIVCAEIHGYLRNLWISRRGQIISL